MKKTHISSMKKTSISKANNLRDQQQWWWWWWQWPGLSEPVADDVRAAGTGWFAALMLLLVISLVAVSVITAIKCRIGAIYPGSCCSFYHRNIIYRWLTAQRYYVQKICFRDNRKTRRSYLPLCGHTHSPPVLLADCVTTGNGLKKWRPLRTIISQITTAIRLRTSTST